MTDKEIIKALECCVDEDCDNCPNRSGIFCIVKIESYALDFINRQQEQLEAAANGQETLQKALADKNKEAAELNLDLKILREFYNCLKGNSDEIIEENKRLRDKVVGLTDEKDQLIKTFGECQEEAIKDFAKAVIDGIDEGYISHSKDIVDFTHNYLRGKGDTE